MGPMDEAHAPVLKMAPAFVQSMGRPWKACGLCDAVGLVRLEAWPKSNARLTWVSLRLSTTCANEGKRCCLR